MKQESKKVADGPVRVSIPSYGIWAFSSVHSSVFVMNLRQDPYYKLVYVTRGSGYLEYEGGRCLLTPGCLVLIPELVQHRFVDVARSPLGLYVLCFTGAALADTSGLEQVFLDVETRLGHKRVQAFCSDEGRGKMLEFFRDLFYEQATAGPGYVAQIVGLFLGLMVHLARDPGLCSRGTAGFDPVGAAIDYLERNFYKPITLPDLSAYVGYSSRRFTALFKQRTGRTFVEYLTGLRIDYAKTRLLESGDIMQAAFDSGFGDLGNFYKVFRKREKMSPGKFLGTFR